MSQQTVLVVDDEVEMCEILEFKLERSGYNVIVCYGGHEALEKVQNEKIDVIISDIRMPNGDGIELLEKSKELKPEIPVIMVSGFSDYSKDEIMERGAKALLPKPFKYEDLLQCIQDPDTSTGSSNEAEE